MLDKITSFDYNIFNILEIHHSVMDEQFYIEYIDETYLSEQRIKKIQFFYYILSSISFLLLVTLLFNKQVVLLSPWLVNQINSINFAVVANLISGIAQVLLIVPFTIFIFSATLLGNAAKIVKEKKASAEFKNKQEFDKNIAELQEKLKLNPNDITGLKTQIDKFEIKKKYTDNEIKKIEKKYNSLGVNDGVIYPVILLTASIFFGSGVMYISENKLWQFFSLLISFVLLIRAVQKIILTLEAAQDVAFDTDNYKTEQLSSSLSKTLETRDAQLRDSLIKALEVIGEKKEPKPILKFEEQPPFVFEANAEIEIKFHLKLDEEGNPEAKNVEAWFILSPEIETLKDDHYLNLKKQKSNFIIPNANGIKYPFPLIRQHTSYPGVLKIKTTTQGKFKLLYRVLCDNHTESIFANNAIDIIVK
jgi:hypothetical protein